MPLPGTINSVFSNVEAFIHNGKIRKISVLSKEVKRVGVYIKHRISNSAFFHSEKTLNHNLTVLMNRRAFDFFHCDVIITDTAVVSKKNYAQI